VADPGPITQLQQAKHEISFLNYFFPVSLLEHPQNARHPDSLNNLQSAATVRSHARVCISVTAGVSFFSQEAINTGKHLQSIQKCRPI